MSVRVIEQGGRVYLSNATDPPGYHHDLDPQAWEQIRQRILDGRLDPDHGAVVAGAGFQQPEPVRYGDGEHDYLSITFEGAAAVVVRDGNDPTGRAMQFSWGDWQQFVREVRGEDGTDGDKQPETPADDGFQAGVHGDKTASKIAQDKAGVDDRVTDQPQSGGETPEAQQERAQQQEQTTGSSRRKSDPAKK